MYESVKRAIYRAIEAVKHATEVLRERGLLHTLDHVKCVERLSGASALDSSRCIIGGRGGLFLVAARASLVKRNVYTLGPVMQLVYDPGAEYVVEASQDLAALLEALIAYEAVGDTQVLIVDGPLIDPPREAPSSQLSIELIEAAAKQLGIEVSVNTHVERALCYSRLAKQGLGVVGYVKRVSGRLLSKLVKAETRDLELLVAMHALMGRDFLVGPLKPAENEKLVSLYHLYGVRIDSYYMVTRAGVARLDFFNTDESLRESIIGYVYGWLLRGLHPPEIISADAVAKLECRRLEPIYESAAKLLTRREPILAAILSYGSWSVEEPGG